MGYFCLLNLDWIFCRLFNIFVETLCFLEIKFVCPHSNGSVIVSPWLQVKNKKTLHGGYLNDVFLSKTAEEIMNNKVIPYCDNILVGFFSVSKFFKLYDLLKTFLTITYLKLNRFWCDPWLHFNNKAYALLIKKCNVNVLYPSHSSLWLSRLKRSYSQKEEDQKCWI